jgi:DivIVA domain-containing protein
MTDASDEQWPRRPAQRLVPERVRATRFTRTPIGRRGLNEDEVVQFLQRVADDIAERDAAEAALRAKVTHYKNTLIQWQREQLEVRPDEGQPGPPPSATGPGSGPGPGPTVAAVNLLSQAQQQADSYVAQTQEYCRRLAADAHDHAQEILSEARAQAEVAGESAAQAYRAQNGTGWSVELEELERRLAWARTFLATLGSVEDQLRTAREALSYEFDKLRPAAAAPEPETGVGADEGVEAEPEG